VFWALGEVLRAECGIVESDSSEQAWQKLRSYVAELMATESSHSRPRGGADRAPARHRWPAELVPHEDDPERMREAFLAALRRGIEAIAARRPFVIAFEDIHWADDGMLDAIEHLAQWVRAPLMLVCLARDELLDRRSSWGGGRRSATS
jgi:predicted ATPase